MPSITQIPTSPYSPSVDPFVAKSMYKATVACLQNMNRGVALLRLILLFCRLWQGASEQFIIRLSHDICNCAGYFWDGLFTSSLAPVSCEYFVPMHMCACVYLSIPNFRPYVPYQRARQKLSEFAFEMVNTDDHDDEVPIP